MKFIRTTSRAAFTLIELLVVVSIIAILASLAIPTANVVMRKAKEAQARALIAGLIAGINNYQTEYNRLPDPTVTNSGTTGYATDQVLPQTSDPNNNLLVLLHPDTTAQPPYGNPRRIDFYDAPPAKNGANGAYVAGGGAGTPMLNDPVVNLSYSQVINVALDYGGDGAIDASKDPTLTAKANIPTTVIAWSTGQPVNPNVPNTGSDAAAQKYFVCSWR